MALLNATPEHETSESVEQRFRRLDALWRKETAYQSSSTKIKNHPAFREVIGMGDAVVPVLLRSFEAGPNLWVWALPEITGADPVAVEDRGKIDKMSTSWLRWGKAQGLSW